MTGRRGLIMWGASGQARVLCELVMGQDYDFIAFVDRTVSEPPVTGAAMLRDASELADWMRRDPRSSGAAGTLAIGWVSDARLALGRTLEDLGIELVTLVHDTAWIARNATLEKGCQVLAHARICAGVQVGANVIVNTGASVDHDTIVGEGSHIAPGATIAGEVVVGRNVFVGMGSIILPRVRIGDGAMIGAGAVVTRNVANGATVIGMPARARDVQSNNG